MLGILRGLASSFMRRTPRSRRICAPMPYRRGSHFAAGLAASPSPCRAATTSGVELPRTVEAVAAPAISVSLR